MPESKLSVNVDQGCILNLSYSRINKACCAVPENVGHLPYQQTYGATWC